MQDEGNYLKQYVDIKAIYNSQTAKTVQMKLSSVEERCRRELTAL